MYDRRVAHYLRGNKTSETPQAACWVDTETHPRRRRDGTIEHHLWFGWACYQRRSPREGWCSPEWLRFERASDFWAWLTYRTRPRTRTYLFAHNWSFDGPVLDCFSLPMTMGWKLTRAIIEAPPTVLTYRYDTRTIQALDTLNWWRVSLAQLGESIGVAKLPMPRTHDPQDMWDAYGRQDVEVIRAACHRWWVFLQEYDLGGFAATVAGQSMRAYRHRFMTERILIDDDPRALTLARGSYYGGRVECFTLGRVKGRVSCLDVNSMYPHVMKAERYPTALVGYTDRATLLDLKRWLRDLCVVADVDIETDEPAYAHVIGERLCYPVGRFRERLTTPDLHAALSAGHIARVHSACVYRSALIFVAFVDYFYAQRIAARGRGDRVTDGLLKVVLNSLYGKFGQRGGKWTEDGPAESPNPRIWDELDADTGDIRHYREYGGLRQWRQPAGESRDSHPAIAAHVTAYARRLLWGLICRAGIEHCHYCDTDSLWIDDAGLSRLHSLIDPTRLGALKLEWQSRDCHLWGCKDYRHDREAKTKGVRKAAHWIDPSTVEQERWSSLRGQLRAGNVSIPTTTRTLKHLSRIYAKGLLGKAGRVSPFTLHEW